MRQELTVGRGGNLEIGWPSLLELKFADPNPTPNMVCRHARLAADASIFQAGCWMGSRNRETIDD
jgi:hypothetical protein